MYLMVIFMKNLKLIMIKGIIFVSVLGTLFHFIYDWSGNNLIIGLFAPLNESIWEHTKLIFFPILIFSLFAKKIITEYPCINSAMILAEITGIMSIIILYYTYSGILGYNVSFVDISIFYISVLISFYTAYKYTLSCKGEKYKTLLSVIQIILIFLYIFFTFNPPGIGIFTVI